MPPLADECLFLDINKLKRDGMLKSAYAHHLRGWRNGEEAGTAAVVCRSTMQIQLVYCLEGPYVGEIGLDGPEIADILEDRNLDDRWITYTVPIVYTTCHFGGWRPWFTCPGSRCGGHRVGKLYLGNRHFFCRHCYGLRYGCQLEREWDRMLRRREKLERRLADDGWSRPKGMHRRTYDRLADELVSIEDRLDGAMIAHWTPDLLPR
jgi:hypothetical protein